MTVIYEREQVIGNQWEYTTWEYTNGSIPGRFRFKIQIVFFCFFCFFCNSPLKSDPLAIYFRDTDVLQRAGSLRDPRAVFYLVLDVQE